VDVRSGCFQSVGEGNNWITVFGEASLDVNTIVLETLSANGLAVKKKKDGRYNCQFRDFNRDGTTDINCLFAAGNSSWGPTIPITGTTSGGKRFIGYAAACTNGNRINLNPDLGR
jgi:hypothetical protein